MLSFLCQSSRNKILFLAEFTWKYLAVVLAVPGMILNVDAIRLAPLLEECLFWGGGELRDCNFSLNVLNHLVGE